MTPLGTKIGIGPGRIVLHENPTPAPLPKMGTTFPIFSPCLCGQTVAHLSYC